MEKWKQIPGYQYEASSLGRIRRNGKLIKVNHSKNKEYTKFSICKDGIVKNMPTHRAVAMAWHPNPENKPQVNHKNGIKTDNRPDNLEWCTPSENKKHAFRTGLQSNRGQNHSQNKLDDLSVRVIREALSQNHHPKDIAKYFGVTDGAIYSIKSGRTWAHL